MTRDRRHIAHCLRGLTLFENRCITVPGGRDFSRRGSCRTRAASMRGNGVCGEKITSMGTSKYSAIFKRQIGLGLYSPPGRMSGVHRGFG